MMKQLVLMLFSFLVIKTFFTTSIFIHSSISSKNYFKLSLSEQNGKYNFSQVDKIIDNAVKDSAFPGASLLVWQNGKTIDEKGFGHFTYNKNSPKVDTSTIYDLASLTKVIATTTAIMLCYDKKLLSLDDKVSKFIPQFAVNDKENITIRNLLLHNSGLPAFKRFYKKYKTPEEVINDIYSSKLIYKTGSKTVYSDLGFVVLAKIVEKISGRRFDSFCNEEIFKKLDMKNTYFNPPDSLKKKIPPTEIDTYWRHRLLQGEVHDETASILNGVSGNAGLFSNVLDIRNFLSMIMNGGIFEGKQFIKSNTIRLFTQKNDYSNDRALGWDLKSDKNSSAGNLFSEDSFGHLGYTGCSIWVDPDKNLFVVFLSNRVYPTRYNLKITKIRPALHDAVINAIEN